MDILFWVFTFGSAYSYIIYPLLLVSFPKRRISVTAEDGEFPAVSFIITVHNEAKRIEQKIRNTRDLDYPAEKIEILVASDASTDETNEIVSGWAERDIKLVVADEHLGKEHAQKLAIEASSGDILVFSDAATSIPKNAIVRLALAFSDPLVGAVSSIDKYVTCNGRDFGEGLYVRFEMWLRRLESNRAGLVGLSGSFFAARRCVCEKWDVRSPSDLNVALECVRNDYVSVSDSSVIGVYSGIKHERREYARKKRTVIRGIVGISRNTDVLSLGRFGYFAFQLWSHKIMRWATPWFMVGALVTNAIIVQRASFYVVALTSQLLFYSIAFAAWRVERLRTLQVFRFALFFVQVNIAMLHATILFLSGERVMTWTPSER